MSYETQERVQYLRLCCGHGETDQNALGINKRSHLGNQMKFLVALLSVAVALKSDRSDSTVANSGDDAATKAAAQVVRLAQKVALEKKIKEATDDNDKKAALAAFETKVETVKDKIKAKIEYSTNNESVTSIKRIESETAEETKIVALTKLTDEDKKVDFESETGKYFLCKIALKKLNAEISENSSGAGAFAITAYVIGLLTFLAGIALLFIGGFNKNIAYGVMGGGFVVVLIGLLLHSKGF
jgi:hypothetical protein